MRGKSVVQASGFRLGDAPTLQLMPDYSAHSFLPSGGEQGAFLWEHKRSVGQSV